MESSSFVPLIVFLAMTISFDMPWFVEISTSYCGEVDCTRSSRLLRPEYSDEAIYHYVHSRLVEDNVHAANNFSVLRIPKLISKAFVKSIAEKDALS